MNVHLIFIFDLRVKRRTGAAVAVICDYIISTKKNALHTLDLEVLLCYTVSAIRIR